MKQEVNKTVNLDLDCYKADHESIIGLFTHVALREGWSQEDINIVIKEALRLEDHDHFTETIKSHCEHKYEVTTKKLMDILNQLGLCSHYLATKEIWKWDKYDYSNYRALKLKAGIKDRVFAIYTSDVKEEDRYRVTTMPTFFFETKEEAQNEIDLFCSRTGQDPSDYLIHTLWRLP